MCRPDDTEWIRSTAAEVYRELGDYRTIISSWLEHPGVRVFVEEDEQRARRGFVLIGYYTPGQAERGGYAERELYFADLLAIAVAPEHQRRGVGKALLAHAFEVCRADRGERPVPEMRLTVAEGNRAAQALFLSFGFRRLDIDYGTYDGGQRAVRMSCEL